MKSINPAKAFAGTGLLCLGLGLVFGLMAGLQYIFPEFLKGGSDFFQNRPMHTTLVTGWIIMTAVGGIYHYFNDAESKLNTTLGWMHYLLTVASGLLFLGAFMLKKFGGREYLESPPLLSLPLYAGWILFGINFFTTLLKRKKKQPVFVWMWGTGVIFFFITFTEAHLWLIPWFRDNIVRDLTVQWKSYGALVGSWNMLVYGTALCLMQNLKADARYTRSNLAFLMYFLGFTNLLFGWGHHTYPVPAQHWIRMIAYCVSMTELLILGKIIRDFARSMDETERKKHFLSFRFLATADLWVFLNLILALLISIPGINFYTHGTHITVAHAMGTTIGINTTILLASLYYLRGNSTPIAKGGRIPFILFNTSLLAFLFCLVMAGIEKSWWMHHHPEIPFSQMMASLWPWFAGMVCGGVGILLTLLYFVYRIVNSKPE